MASLPLLAFYFQQFSLVSFLANLLVLPLLESAMIFGLGSLAAGLIFRGHNTDSGMGLVSRACIFRQLPCLFVRQGARSVGLCTAAGSAGRAAYFAALTIFWRRTLPALQQGGLWLVVCALWLGPLARLPPELEVHMLDVGEGDALVVLTPHRHAWVVDAGGVWRQGDAGSKVVVPHLRRLGVSKLQGIVLDPWSCRPHGRRPGAVSRRPSDASFSNRWKNLRRSFTEAVIGVSSAAPTPRSILKATPLRSPGGLVKGENDESLVVWLAYGEKSFLLTGDAVRELLAAAGFALRCVENAASWIPLCLGGRSWQALPQIALISVGRNNSFGHPHAFRRRCRN